MGRANQSPALLVVGLLLPSATTPLVHGQQLVAPLSLITLIGRLCCSSTRNCLGNAPGIPGVLITMACNAPGLGAGACPILKATKIVGYPSLLSTVLSPLRQLVGNYWAQWAATS